MLVPALLLVAEPKISGLKPSEPRIYQPKVGSPDRKALMEALWKETRPSLRQPVVVKVDWIRSNVSAASFEGLPVRPDGGPIDYLKTDYAEKVRDRVFDDGAFALWRDISRDVETPERVTQPVGGLVGGLVGERYRAVKASVGRFAPAESPF